MTTKNENTESVQKHNIQMVKASHGWQATSQVTLAKLEKGTRILKLTTSKTRGGIDSGARVYIQNFERGFCSETTDIFGDFHKNGINPIVCKRITEKAILEAHQLVLAHMDVLVNEAKEFTAKKDAETKQAF